MIMIINITLNFNTVIVHNFFDFFKLILCKLACQLIYYCFWAVLTSSYLPDSFFFVLLIKRQTHITAKTTVAAISIGRTGI